MTVIKIYLHYFFIQAEKLRLQEELFKLRSFRRDHEARKEHLLNKAKVLQNRASKFRAKVIIIIHSLIIKFLALHLIKKVFSWNPEAKKD